MKAKFGFLASLVLVITSSALGGPIVVGNGGGEGEFSVIFVAANLKEILSECEVAACALSSSEKTQLTKLEASIARAAHPVMKALGDELFEIHESEVWINQSRIWEDTAHTKPFNLGDAGALCLQILAAGTDMDTARLQTKLRNVLSSETLRAEVIAAGASAVEFVLWKNTASDLLIVRGPQLETIDLMPSLSKAIGCEDLRDLRVFSPTWLALSPSHLTLQFGATWTCGSAGYSSHGFADINLVRSGQGYAVDASAISSFVEH